jgi:hypothetical protein
MESSPEATRNAWRDILVLQGVKMRFQNQSLAGAGVLQPADHCLRGIAAEIDLRAIAGRNQHNFAGPGVLRDGGERRPLHIQREGNLLADFNGCGAVI